MGVREKNKKKGEPIHANDGAGVSSRNYRRGPPMLGSDGAAALLARQAKYRRVGHEAAC